MFNRSLDSEIPAKIELEGFRYAAGSAEVLYQDDPGTVKYFEPQKEAVPGSGSSFRWKFKPHSMTAFTPDRRGIAGGIRLCRAAVSPAALSPFESLFRVAGSGAVQRRAERRRSRYSRGVDFR